MAKKLTEVEHKAISELIRSAHGQIAGYMIEQQNDLDSPASTVHTEIFYTPKGEKKPRKYIISTSVDEYTEELKNKLTNNKNDKENKKNNKKG